MGRNEGSGAKRLGMKRMGEMTREGEGNDHGGNVFEAKRPDIIIQQPFLRRFAIIFFTIFKLQEVTQILISETNCQSQSVVLSNWKSSGIRDYEFYFKNIVGKGENASYQHFLLFPQCFLTNGG